MDSLDSKILLVLLGAAISAGAFIAKSEAERTKIVNETIYYLLNLWYIAKFSNAALSGRFLEETRKMAVARWGEELAANCFDANSEEFIRQWQIGVIRKIRIDPLRQIDENLKDKLRQLSQYHPIESFTIFGNSDIYRLLDDIHKFIDANKNPSDDEAAIEGLFDMISEHVNTVLIETLEDNLRVLSWKSSTLQWMKIILKIRKIKKSYEGSYKIYADRVLDLIEQAITKEVGEKNAGSESSEPPKP